MSDNQQVQPADLVASELRRRLEYKYALPGWTIEFEHRKSQDLIVVTVSNDNKRIARMISVSQVIQSRVPDYVLQLFANELVELARMTSAD